MAYQNFGDAPRQMFEGDWKCSECGTAITKLPFQPDENRLGQLRCRDCFKKNRPAFGGGRGGFGGGR